MLGSEIEGCGTNPVIISYRAGMAKLNSFKDLLVWQKAIALSAATYKLTSNYPKEEMFGLTTQTRRAVNSISFNIAEGYGRNTTKNYVSFLYNALGSLNETDSAIVLAIALDFIAVDDAKAVEELVKEESKMLNALIKSLENKIK